MRKTMRLFPNIGFRTERGSSGSGSGANSLGPAAPRRDHPARAVLGSVLSVWILPISAALHGGELW